MAEKQNILTIGGGKMGSAISKILAANDWPGEIGLVTKSSAQAKEIAPFLPKTVKVGPAYEFSFSYVKVIILAIKPQDMEKLCCLLAGKFNENVLVISIAAGITLSSLQQWLKHEIIIRSMPNALVQIGQGATVWMATTKGLNPANRSLAKKIFSLWGQEEEVVNEQLLDVSTATFGSGPAYVLRFIQGVMAGAIKNGFPRDLSRKLAIQTIKGTLALAEQNPQKHLADLCDEIITPGGTTAQALHVFNQKGLEAIITEAIEAALKRCQELNS